MRDWWRKRGRFAKFAMAGSLTFAAALLVLAALVVVEKQRFAAGAAPLRAKGVELAGVPPDLGSPGRWLTERWPAGKTWLAKLLTTHYRVTSYHGEPLNDADARFLAPLAAKDLRLWNKPALTDGGFVDLHRARDLEWVDLTNANIGDATALALAKGHGGTLKSVFLDGTKVGDDGIASLAGLPRLQYLSLARTRVTDAGLRRLRLSLPARLELDGLPITDAGAAAVANLRPTGSVSLVETQVSDAGVSALRQAGWRVKVGGRKVRGVVLHSVEFRTPGEFDPGTIRMKVRVRVDEKLTGPIERRARVERDKPRIGDRLPLASFHCSVLREGHLALHPEATGLWVFEAGLIPEDYAPGSELLFAFRPLDFVYGEGKSNDPPVLEYVLGRRTVPPLPDVKRP